MTKPSSPTSSNAPPPYDELENAPYRTVRRWILDWITEARERLAEGM